MTVTTEPVPGTILTRSSASNWDLGAYLFLGLVLATEMAGCGAGADGLFCEKGACGWSAQDVTLASSLADLPVAPPVDRSNKYVTLPAAQILGQKLYYDPRFSGNSTQLDYLNRPVPFARVPKGQPLNLPCVGCHDPNRGGVDPATVPGNVSIGAAWTDTNAPSSFNLAFQFVLLWAARADSMWAQAVGGNEGSINSTRLKTAWVIADLYRADYDAIFTDWPLPLPGKSTDLAPLLETDGVKAGQCKVAADGSCPAPCRSASDATGGAVSCWPRFPLQGKPGKTAGCQAGNANEPFGDAFDCMDPADQTAVTRVLVNYAKAISAYETQLISRDSPFDRFIHDLRAGKGDDSTAIPAAAKNGARLFVGKAGCVECHNTPMFTDGKVHNVGVAQVGPGVPTLADCPVGSFCDCVTPNNCLPWGARDGVVKLHNNKYRRDSMWSDDPTDDSRKALYNLAPTEDLTGAWRTSSLRDVALTAPYMHDGALATLADVVAQYNSGGSSNGIGAKAAAIKPLYLSADEQSDLVEFLKTLNGAPIPAQWVTAPVLP